MNTIILRNAHGTFSPVAAALDMAMLRYLPASVNELREHMEIVINPGFDYSDVHNVTEFLVMIADAEGI